MIESAESIYALLVEANPVVDVDAIPTTLVESPHLRSIDTRRDDMQTQDLPRIGTEPPAHRRRWVPAAAAAAAVLVIGVVSVMLTRSGSEPVASSPQEVAEQVITTWNGGDIDAFFARFSSTATVNGTAIDRTDTVRLDLGFYMGLGQEVSIDACTTLGETAVTCRTTTSDQLSGPLGVATPITWEMEIEDELVTQLQFVFPPADQPDLFVVVEEMVDWIAVNHSDVYEERFRATAERCTPEDFNFYGDWCSSLRGAEEMLRLAPEFRESR